MILLIETVYEFISNSSIYSEFAGTWKIKKIYMTFIDKVPSLKTELSFDRLIKKEICYIGY